MRGLAVLLCVVPAFLALSHAWAAEPPLDAAAVQAVRTASAPVIDGRLDDACWSTAKPYSGFLATGTGAPASPQTTGYVLYDDQCLYIGVKCQEPEPKAIKAQAYPHDGPVYHDDAVEIMIDAGATRSSYVQLIVNAAGATFDTLRSAGGAAEDDSWNGEWEAAATIAADSWSCEVRVPYATLGVTAATGQTWGLNLCRDKTQPPGASAIAAMGAYNRADAFVPLQGIRADVGKYVVRLGEAKFVPRLRDGKIVALLTVPVRNESPGRQELSFETSPQGQTRPFELAGGQELWLEVEELPLRAGGGRHAGVYGIATPATTRAVRIKDREGKLVLASRNLAPPESLRVIELRRLEAAETPAPVTLQITIDPVLAALPGHRLALTVADAAGREVVSQLAAESGPTTQVALPAAALPGGELRARVVLQTAAGAALAEGTLSFTHVTTPLRRLNNLVVELLDARCELVQDTPVRLSFENPRRGWVFISATPALEAGGRVSLSLPDACGPEPVLVSEPGSAAPAETMRQVPAGAQVLQLRADARGTVRLAVRAVPELVFCKYGYNPHVVSYGPYDWPYLRRHVLANVNTIVACDPVAQEPQLREWRQRGGKWLIECGFPGLVNAPLEEPTPESAFTYWSEHPGYANPLLDGILVDEVGPGQSRSKLAAWGEAVRRLKNAAPDKVFYPYCYGVLPTDAYGREFAETVIDAGGQIAWERYLQEEPTEDAARQGITAALKHELQAWERSLPGCREHLLITFGYLTSITAETQSVWPQVDFKAYLDMQYHFLATDPDCTGVFGIQNYTCGYVDEEYLRWASRLLRHYAIEGNTEPLAARYGYAYLPGCLENGDFAQGTSSWGTSPAEEGAIGTGTHAGYGGMQGRMVPGSGDHFLLLKRSAARPNRVQQTAAKLVPGKLYALKLVTGNYDELLAGKSSAVRHGVSVDIANADLVKERCFVDVRPNLYCYFIPPFSATNCFFFNLHRYVFRARGDTAEITLRDWATEADPGGPAGQRLMLNFAELQPYFDE